MMSNGEPLDLYKLFMVVKEKGGYDAVCKNRLWDLVGEEYGLGVKVGPSVELVYCKYLITLETWLKKNVADSKFPECGLVDDRANFGKKLMDMHDELLLDDYDEKGTVDGLRRVYDYLDGRKLCGTNRVRGLNPELNGAKKVQNGNYCEHNCARDILELLNEDKASAADISDEVNSIPGLLDGGKRCDDNDDDDNINNDDVIVIDPCSFIKEGFGHKRKRESMLDMLSWISGVAKNPCDPVVGSMPEKSKWKSYSSQAFWKQVLLFREAAFLKRSSESSSEHLSWKGQKMHPCMYEDQPGGANYNLRDRLTCDKRVLLGKSTSGGKQGCLEGSSGSNSKDCAEIHFLDGCATVPIPIGPSYQAEVPEWTGMTYENDAKWLGNQIWPPEKVNSKIIERDPIGMGRKDSCGCQVVGSVECVQFHIGEKKAKVKLELGVAFYLWNFHKAGEDVKRFWTEADEKKFKDVVKSNPPSLEKCFWDQLFQSFPRKSREDLVSYYFNVFLLQRRAFQNRNTPKDIDSDDDESEYGPLKKYFGHLTHNSRSFTLLSPKKPKTKGK